MDDRPAGPPPPPPPLAQLRGEASGRLPPAAESAAGERPSLVPGGAAAVFGVLGLALGPVLIGHPTGHYLILLADLAALALGAWALVVAIRSGRGLDLAVGALIAGGISLFLYASFMTDPPAGGT
jgi:hypothetical protein